MKKTVALLLLAAMLLTSLVGCGYDENDKGAIIPLYLSGYQRNLDPTAFIYDKDTIKYTTLIYEGLTVIAEDGSIEPGLAEEWYTEKDRLTGETVLYFKLKSSRWNDGRLILADHFVYAWKRLLSPEVYAPAASLLYDIKNAKAVKSGEMTIDDLGVAAVDNSLLEVTFEKDIDIDLFLEAVASPALVPIRDDVVTGEHITDWASSPENIATNGQFTMKAMEYGGKFNVEKSTYYNTTDDDDVSPNKYVKPFRLITDFSSSLEKQLEKFNNGEIYYLDALPADEYDNYEDDLTVQPLLSTFSFFFNCSNGILSDAYARKAMSVALDRTAIAEAMGCGTEPATGIVSNGVFDTKMKKSSSFREAGGELISAAADMDTAKSLMNDVSNDGSTYTLTIRKNKADQKAAAEAAVAAWKQLGINVEIKELSDNDFYTALTTSDFDIIALDYQGLSTSAYSFLAPFAKYYSGSVVSVSDDSTGFTPHITNFAEDNYDQAIDAVLEATTRADRAAALHDAESLLVEYAPIAPVVFYNNYYLESSELSGLDSTAFGTRIFKDAKLKNYLEKNEALLAAESDK